MLTVVYLDRPQDTICRSTDLYTFGAALDTTRGRRDFCDGFRKRGVFRSSTGERWFLASG
jgi:hypothetical protein